MYGEGVAMRLCNHYQAWANYALKTTYYVFEQCSAYYAQNYAPKIKIMLDIWLFY